MIYCVKLSQRALTGRKPRPTLFPYDRVYLVPADKMSVADKMFQYYYYTEITDDALNLLIAPRIYESYRHIPVIGRPTISTDSDTINGVWAAVRQKPHFAVVPTLLTVHRDRKNKIVRKTQYFMTNALRNARHKGGFTEIGFHTPERNIPLICAACINYAAYCQNVCSPGNDQCRTKVCIIAQQTSKEASCSTDSEQTQ